MPQNPPRALHESGEMYLETIYLLLREKGTVRSVDVCEEMGYSKPSISRAVTLLRADGYLEMDESGYLTLTPRGKEIAEKTYDRHTTLAAFFEAIGVPAEAAAEDACKIEHVISDETFTAVKRFAASLPMGGSAGASTASGDMESSGDTLAQSDPPTAG